MTSRHTAPHDLASRVVDLVTTAPRTTVFQPTSVGPDGAVVLADPVTVDALYEHASILAARMAAWRDRRVALAVHIGEEAVALYLACQLVGIAPAMLPVPARADEVPEFAAVVTPLATAFSPDIVVFDRQSFARVQGAGQVDSWRGEVPAQVITAQELGEAAGGAWGGPDPRRAPGLDATAHYLFTSGTTGRAKVVRLSRGAVVRNAVYVAERWRYGVGDRLPVVGPPYHSAGLMVGLVMPLYVGAAGVFSAEMTSPAHPLEWLRLVAETRCTHISCGDGLIRAVLLGLPIGTELRYPDLRALILGGEPLDLHTYELVEQHFAPRAAPDFAIYTAYGMTEAAGLISTATHTRPTRLWLRSRVLDRGAIEVLDTGPARSAMAHDTTVVVSCGSPSHGVELRVVDAAGQPLPDGTLGRIEFRSPCLFDGYVSDPAEAMAALKVSAASLCSDGFFATGDLGFRYAGELFIRGRRKEAISVGATLLPAERIELIARAACVAAAGHHGVTAHAAAGTSAPELMVMQEVSAGPGAEAHAAAISIARALRHELGLPSVRIAVFEPGALPRLCTSAKKVRMLAAAALARGDLSPIFSQRFVAPELDAAGAITESAWCAADLSRDRRWLIPLGAGQAAALAHAVSGRRTADAIAEPIRGPLEEAAREAAGGFGFAVIRGLPADLPLADLERMVMAVGAAIGQPMPQNLAGQRLTHVQARNAQPGARGYLSREALAFHSDTSDLLALFCVRNAVSGGETALVSSLRVFRELAALDARDELAALRAGFVYAYPDTTEVPDSDARAGGAAERPRIPVFSDSGGRISCRYLRAFIELAERRYAIPLSETERRALDRFDHITARFDLQLRLRLEPGDLLLVNNYSVLHARTAFDDAADEARKRLLLRLWINVPHFRSVVPMLQRLSERFVNHHARHHARPDDRDFRIASLHHDRGVSQA